LYFSWEVRVKALLIVDVQNDFCPGGALAVKNGDHVVPVLNGLMQSFPLVLASRDWHPEGSVHYQKWPVHCLQGTAGADYHPDLIKAGIHQELFKGTDNKDDGYSAFEATNIDLDAFLISKGVTDLYIGGLATDYCVKASAIDAAKHGYLTFVILDAIRAVDVKPGDGERALEEMGRVGIRVITSAELLAR
jgi:nicotinamidase/pyrazinamidase